MRGYWLKAIGHARGRRPRIAPGDRLVLHASVHIVPVLDAPPPVEAIGVAARSMSRQSHIRIDAGHCACAVEALASVAADR